MDIDNKIKYLKNYLKEEILPHVGTSNIKKSYFLGIMCKKLLDLLLNKIEQDDRDSYTNKRIDGPGILMGNNFRVHFTKMIKDTRNSVMKELNNGSWRTLNKFEDVINSTNIYKLIKSTTIEIGLKYSLATGNWSMKNNSSKKVGVAQVLSRLSNSSTLSHLRRVNTPIEKTGKLIPPRKLHPTGYGYMCPCETPEGASIGIVKNLSISATITNYTTDNLIKEILLDNKVIDIDNIHPDKIMGFDKIFINGDIFGVSDNAYTIYILCKNLKKSGVINIFTSIIFDYRYKELYFYTEAGRLTRPLLLVENNKLLLNNEIIDYLKNGDYNWNNLIIGTHSKYSLQDFGSCIEFIDVQENNNIILANDELMLKNNIDKNNHKRNNKNDNKKDNQTDNENKNENYNNKIIKYTHCEIHPSCILGVLACAIPFSDHNQSPRNTYQSAMGKQAMGIYSTNYLERMDTLGHILHYPSLPIVNTILTNYLNSVNTPNGCMAVVAIMSGNGGYNQEDSVMINKSAVDRGLFISTFYRTYKDEEKKSQISGLEEKFCQPNSYNTKGLKPGDYSKLDINGFAKVNSNMNGGDVIIGKVIPCKQSKSDLNESKKYRDNSTSLRCNETGLIDKVYENRR